MNRPKGMLPAAFLALQACEPAGFFVDRIVQTVGNAPASKGTHSPDGTFTNERGETEAYTVATDLSVRNPTPLSASQTRELLGNLAEVGIAAFYRLPGSDSWPASEVVHIHAICCLAPMKLALRNQVHDWCNGRNGLKRHAPYTFWQPSEAQKTVVRAAFLAHNPANG